MAPQKDALFACATVQGTLSISLSRPKSNLRQEADLRPKEVLCPGETDASGSLNRAQI